ncbi:hypothetical protein [Trichothermofontia sp.]
MATFLTVLKQLGYLEQTAFTVFNVGSRKLSAGIVQVLAQSPQLVQHGLEKLPVVAKIKDFITRPELLNPH